MGGGNVRGPNRCERCARLKMQASKYPAGLRVNVNVIKVGVLLGILAAPITSAANATEISTSTAGILRAGHHARDAQGPMMKSVSFESVSLWVAGVGAPFEDGFAAVDRAFGGRLLPASLISYQVPFLVSSIGMPPSHGTRQAAGSSSSPSGMSSFFRRMVGGFRSAPEGTQKPSHSCCSSFFLTALPVERAVPTVTADPTGCEYAEGM